MSKIKPIVIVVDKDGHVSMTVEEMKKLLDDAFEQGKESGTTTINNYPYHYRGWWNDPYYSSIATCNNDNAKITVTGTATSGTIVYKESNNAEQD